MKVLTQRLVLPLTIISFTDLTQWWYVLPVDAPDSMMIGFPLAYACDGWHTSMSLQIFILEFLFDLSVYFGFWFVVIICTDRYLKKIRLPRLANIILWLIAALHIAAMVFIASMPENIYKLKRDFDTEILATGFKFGWKHQQRPGLD